MKSLISSVIALQFILTSSLPAWAQDVQVKPITGGITQTASNVWGDNGGGDPWNVGSGASDPTWGNTGPGGMGSGSWGSTDPNGVGNYDPSGYGNSFNMGYQNYNALDGFAEFAIQTSGVLTYPYQAVISELKKNESYEKSDDKIADELISQAWREAAADSRDSAYLFTAGAYNLKLNPNAGGLGQSIGFGMGFVGQLGYDFYTVFKVQAKLILSLAALYGQLPTNPQERVRLISDQLTWAALASTLETRAQVVLQKAIEKGLGVKPDPIIPPGGGGGGGGNPWDPNPLQPTPSGGTQPAAEMGQSVAKGEHVGAIEAEKQMGLFEAEKQVATAEANIAQDPAVKKALQKEVTTHGSLFWKFRIVNGMQKADNPAFQKLLNLSDNSKKLIAAGVSTSVVALVAYGLDGYTTMKVGGKVKAKLKLTQAKYRAAALRFVKTDPRAHKTLWVLISRDVFKRSLLSSDANQKNELILANAKFARALNKTIPWMKNKMWDEQLETIKEFAADPKMPDKNLVALKDIMNMESKLIFMHYLISAMLVKGSLSQSDITSLDTVAIYLGLIPPPKMNWGPNDIRNDDKARYLSMSTKLIEETNTRFLIIQGTPTEKLPPILSHYGASGSIVLEDYALNTNKSYMDKLDLDAKSYFQLNPEQIQKNREIAIEESKKLLGIDAEPPQNVLDEAIKKAVATAAAASGAASSPSKAASGAAKSASGPASATPPAPASSDAWPTWGN